MGKFARRAKKGAKLETAINGVVVAPSCSMSGGEFRRVVELGQ